MTKRKEPGQKVDPPNNQANSKHRKNNLINIDETTFKNLFNKINSCVAVYKAVDNGKDFIFIDFNRAAEMVDSIKKKDLIGRKVTEVFPMVKDFGLFKIFQKVWKTGNPQHHPISLYKDNRIIGWRENYVYKLPSGKIVAVYENKTKEKQAKQKLIESEHMYKSLFRYSNDAIFTHDTNGKILDVNEKACELLKYSKKELLKKNIIDLHPPEMREVLKDTFKKEHRNRHGDITETQLLCKDKSRIDVEVSFSILNFEKEIFLGIVRDVSERHKNEMLLKNQNKFLNTVFESIINPFCVIDVKTYEAVKYNSAISKKSNTPQYCYTLLHNKKKPCNMLSLECPIDKIVQTKKPIIIEHIHYDKNKNEKFYEMHCHPILDEKGNVIQIIEYILDTTLKKKMNIELAKRVHEKTKEAQQIQTQLFHTSKLATLGEMATGIAHEINQPLNGISLTIENIKALKEKNKLTSRQIDKCLRDLKYSIKRMSNIIKHIRTFARQDDLPCTSVNVNDTIESALDLLGEQLRLHEITVIKKLENNLPIIIAEPFQLEQVWINLISNARDAVEMKSSKINSKNLIENEYVKEINISSTVKNSKIIIKFTDNGNGISNDIINKVFEPFFTTKEVGKSSGLGLSISYGIIESHKGKIKINSQKGTKTTVTIKFPVPKN